MGSRTACQKSTRTGTDGTSKIAKRLRNQQAYSLNPVHSTQNRKFTFASNHPQHRELNLHHITKLVPRKAIPPRIDQHHQCPANRSAS